MISVDNDYQVPRRQWNHWSEAQRVMFNEVYDTMLHSQWAFSHPKAKPMTDEHWQTVAWNAAWTAAHNLLTSQGVRSTTRSTAKLHNSARVSL